MKTAALIFVMLASLLLGCRTVWVHPEASQQKYTEDYYSCRFGTEPPTQEAIRQGELPDVAARPDWKQCMALLGWTSKVGMRWNEPYSE